MEKTTCCKSGWIKTILLKVMVGLCAPGCLAQTSGQACEVWKPLVGLTSSRSSWKLARDPVHPAGPGYWLQERRTDCAGQRTSAKRSLSGSARVLPVIRVGERLIVEDRMPRVEARLQAVALEPAHRGDSILARLTAGGAVIRAVVLGPGYAVLTPQVRVYP